MVVYLLLFGALKSIAAVAGFFVPHLQDAGELLPDAVSRCAVSVCDGSLFPLAGLQPQGQGVDRTGSDAVAAPDALWVGGTD